MTLSLSPSGGFRALDAQGAEGEGKSCADLDKTGALQKTLRERLVN